LGKAQGPFYGLLLLALTVRLAWQSRRPWVARGAALLVGLSPVFLNSVPAGDPDLALSYYSMASLFVILQPLAGTPNRLAGLCGLELGLALWAKQAAGPLVGSVVVLAGLTGLGLIRFGWLSPRTLARTLVVGGLLAAPWYLRNAALTGQVLVLASAADSAMSDRSLPSLLAPIRWWDELGCPGSPFLSLGLVTLGLAALAPEESGTCVSARRLGVGLGLLVVLFETLTRACAWAHPPLDTYVRAGGLLLAAGLLLSGQSVGLNARPTVQLAWLLPLLMVWWVKFSFTARYLLPLVPVLAIAGAGAGARALGPLFRRSPAAWALVLPAVALLTSETYPLWRLTLVRAFEMSGRPVEAKWSLYPGAPFRVARWLNRSEHVRKALIGTNDSRLAYFLDPSVTVTSLPALEQDLRNLDWVVLGPCGAGITASPGDIRRSQESVRSLLGDALPALTDEGYEVYRLKSTAVRTR
jgi:hypothetical protein